jgi:hypothetical protein
MKLHRHLSGGHMAQLALFVGGIALTGWAVACGARHVSDDGTTGFDGVYEVDSAESGAPDDIGGIVFVDQTDYMLMTNACADTSCAELGVYDYDEAAQTITFTNTANGARRVVSVNVLERQAYTPDNTLKPQAVTNGGTQVGGNGNSVSLSGGTNGVTVGVTVSAPASSLTRSCPAGSKPGGTTTGGSVRTTTGQTGSGSRTSGSGSASASASASPSPPASGSSSSASAGASSASASDGCQMVTPPTQIAFSFTIGNNNNKQQTLTKNNNSGSSNSGSNSSGSSSSNKSSTGSNGGTTTSTTGSKSGAATTSDPTTKVQDCGKAADAASTAATTPLTPQERKDFILKCAYAALGTTTT